MKGLRILSVIIICILGPVRISLAADQSPNAVVKENKYGVSASVSRIKFFGGSQSGPETLLSDTNYQDTFDTGYGWRVEGFYEWKPALRVVLGIVHNEWDGKFFVGGVFPAGAQFDDFSLTGVYIGLKYRFRLNSRLRPFLLGNLGIVRLSSLDVTVSGSEIPYWDSTYRDYLNVGTGIEYRLTDKLALFLDARLELFGEPDSANSIISDATGASAFPITFGIDYKF